MPLPSSSNKSGSPDSPNRAVVLGASMAGLLAARVLSEHFQEVILLERDNLPQGPEPRKGTPHAMQPHGLLARGLQILESLFPGFTSSMQARGGLLGDLAADCHFSVNRERFASCQSGVKALVASRLTIEAEVRARVLSLGNVRVLTNVSVLSPQFQDGQVTAARFQHLSDGVTQELPARLVMDCTGRGSRASQWLKDWGYVAPQEERVEIGIAYTSAYFKRTGSLAMGAGLDRVASFGAVTNAQPRPGVLLAQEPDADGTPRWVVGVGGYRGDHAEATLEAIQAHARAIGSADLVKVTHEGELIGQVIRYQMPYSLRRRYEWLQHVPRGLLVMGDAITSFNPIYGQGMTVAACEALALQSEIQRDGQAVDASRFFRRTAKIIDNPWQIAVGGDLSIDTVPGHRPWAVKVVNAYIARVYRVAPHDPVVSLAFQRVVHMLDQPAALFAPRMLWRVWGPRWARVQTSLDDTPSVVDPRHSGA